MPAHLQKRVFFFPQKRINATLAPRIILLGLLEWGAIAFSEKEEVAWFKFLICQLSAVMTLDKVLYLSGSSFSSSKTVLITTVISVVHSANDLYAMLLFSH